MLTLALFSTTLLPIVGSRLLGFTLGQVLFARRFHVGLFLGLRLWTVALPLFTAIAEKQWSFLSFGSFHAALLGRMDSLRLSCCVSFRAILLNLVASMRILSRQQCRPQQPSLCLSWDFHCLHDLAVCLVCCCAGWF